MGSRLRSLWLLASIAAAPCLSVGCRSKETCLFASATCGGDEPSAPTAPVPTFAPSDPALDGGCDDSIRTFDAAADLDAGDGVTASP
ncbi:MAG: hypothetical protein JWP87_4160, partial [Labilithrix sp.]|nr:hypothetical protein [Labilithrix sp.]